MRITSRERFLGWKDRNGFTLLLKNVSVPANGRIPTRKTWFLTPPKRPLHRRRAPLDSPDWFQAPLGYGETNR